MSKTMYLEIEPCDSFALEIDSIASDKSISHRCAIFSLLSDEPSYITNFLRAEDTMNSLAIAQSLGAKATFSDSVLTIVPPKRIEEPSDVLECGNSGTTIRLMSGFLASIEGFFVLSGDQYLRARPMKRIVEPLRRIGAQIDGRADGNLAPLAIRGKKLEGITYSSPISSAQVKSALILAALHAKTTSIIDEPYLSRDHTERMLTGMGADITVTDNIVVQPLTKPLKPLRITVPADPSSAFFFAVAAAITPNASILLKNVSLNKTRIEAFYALERMGAYIECRQKEDVYEPIGDIYVEARPLHGIDIDERISWLVDELPALAVAMACAVGTSRVKNAKELRVKESDRIKTVIENLRRCSIECEEHEDGYTIQGGTPSKCVFESYGDHRIAMSFAIMALRMGGSVQGFESTVTSFPHFAELLSRLSSVRSYEI